MSYLTVIPMPPRATAGDLHRVTMGLFGAIDAPADQRRAAINLLWRAGTSTVLVRSDIEPERLPEGSKVVMEEPPAVSVGQRVSFMVVVDAVRRGRDAQRRVTTTPVAGDSLEQWLTERLSPALSEVSIRFSTATGTTTRKGATLNPVAILGEATVADVAALAELLRAGVGRSKAFGCGLLTIA